MKIPHTIHFDVNDQDIKDVIGVQTLTEEQIKTIGEILVANLESSVDEDDEIMMSDSALFNDAYNDMIHDMCQEYNPDYVDDQE